MADTARLAQTQRQGRRPGSRIVPAIPYRLSRAQPSARPITPEESNKGAVTQQPAPPPPEQQEADEKRPGEQDQEQEQEQEQKPEQAEEPQAVAPPTPDSRTSGAGKSEAALEEEQTGAPDAASHVNGHAQSTPVAPSEPKPARNGHRKLTIPAHLPPPFYPSTKPDNQTPPADGSDTAHTLSHRHQLSAGAVVFQSANASPVVPVAPQGPELEVQVQEQHSLAHPPPGLEPPQFAPFFPPHPHPYPAEAGAPWQPALHTIAPATPAPPALVHDNGVEHPSPQLPNGPYNGHFSPAETGFATNGTSSHAQSPSKLHFGSEHGEVQHARPYQNGTALPTERLEHSPFELASYLSTQYGNPEFSDFILQVRSLGSTLLSVPVHGIVVVRSPVIAEAVRRSPAPSHRTRDARRLVDVLAVDPLTTPDSLVEAVRVLYGAPLLSAQTFLYGLVPYMYDSDQVSSPSNDARRRMEQILSYIAAARTLQMPSMQARGVDIARMLLRWDTVDQVLQYTLQANPGLRLGTEGPESGDPFISTLLGYALEFVAYTFPLDFELYTFAPEFKDAPRLPTVVEPRQTTHNPRLSKIQFGDAPLEDDHQPSYATIVLSTILLSLPLPLLERLFNHRATANQIGWTGAAKILRHVINERENRRQKASRGQLKRTQDGTIPTFLQSNMYIEERIEQVEPSPLHPSGHRLATKQVPGEA
ncbi:hypothetical protein BDW02DRAFT_566427 [Decorospora gaudefroyi]|uniref:BTB domain-containing protein n=1 Tax=Decorospora gaudefroyi TaxID=184978 RepID=A0A6A5KMG1_9PLEO|nr:hypothetical protein BDW02DRAFT_566427 [Decorospora gaudefroyi]